MVLSSALRAPSGTSQDDMDRAVRRAIYDHELPTNFTETEFLKVVSKHTHALKDGKINKYTVLFQITLTGERPSGRYPMNDCLLVFPEMATARKAKMLLKKQSEFLRSHEYLYSSPVITVPYRPVLAHVQALNVAQAMQMARDAMDEVRGLMNLFENAKTYSRLSWGGRPSPINKAKLLPVSTVHDVNGDVAGNQFWFENGWESPSEALDPRNRITGFSENFPKWIRRIKQRHGLSNDARIAIRQYVRSIDDADWRQAFQGLWIALEYMTNINNADYDKLIDRASKIYSNHEHHRETLRHLRKRRNQIIHEASDAPISETIVFQTKNIVEDLIKFYSANYFKFKSRDELAEFLDLPREEKHLKHKMKLLERALMFRDAS